MPTMCVFDGVCGEERGSTGNAAEPITVVALVRWLLDAGVTLPEIGVIAFYKAQAEAIAQPLAKGKKRAAVDILTTDVFQGDEREVIISTTAKTTKISRLRSFVVAESCQQARSRRYKTHDFCGSLDTERSQPLSRTQELTIFAVLLAQSGR
jgi:hypothetical protein